ncbi:serine hydrolase [Parvibaculaceae bacterium PLY_AMNH_Bact1]|nr:serine hydrolase [Parvibaculaceae bacterium PLY_AMNH_Bact1]
MHQLKLLLAVVLLFVAWGTPAHSALPGTQDGGMLTWPRAEMARALSLYLPRRMAEEDVRALSIAVIADGQIVFEQGYGAADIVGSEPVTANTLFEAASLGKPVAAVGALSMVREGLLDLDAPLGAKLAEPWLGDGDDHELITLRHVLTHTSGLTNFIRCCSDESWATPGEGFSYSGVGFMYMGHVMAQLDEKPFESVMRARVLGPLGMASSGYGLAEPLVPTVARGFVPFYQALLAFFVPLFLFSALSALLTFLIVRFGLNRLKLEPVDFAPAVFVSSVGTLGIIWLLLGGWGLLFILGNVLVYLSLFLLGVLLLITAFAFLGLLGPADGTLSRGGQQTNPVAVAVAVGLVFALSLLFMERNTPVPATAGDAINPASSLRASAHDLGLFVEGVLRGDVIGSELRDRVLAQNVPIGSGVGWGLGFGTRDGRNGLTGWQWGSNPGFQSLMVIDVERRGGIVVLTNSSTTGPLVQEIAGHVMGEEPGWSLP